MNLVANLTINKSWLEEAGANNMYRFQHRIFTRLGFLALVGCVGLLFGCQGESESTTAVEQTPAKTSTAQQIVADADPADTSPRVYMIVPQDGQTVGRKVHVVFGLSGMGVAPAGVDKPNTGHHHLLINRPELPAPGMPLPATEQIVHFGGGQTETWIDLPPGQHTLQLLLGDFAHRPHAEPIRSELITVTVAE